MTLGQQRLAREKIQSDPRKKSSQTRGSKQQDTGECYEECIHGMTHQFRKITAMLNSMRERKDTHVPRIIIIAEGDSSQWNTRRVGILVRTNPQMLSSATLWFILSILPILKVSFQAQHSGSSLYSRHQTSMISRYEGHRGGRRPCSA